MSEKEQSIINYIVERFGVSKNQALTILNGAKNNVPKNYQEEVIDFLYNGLSGGGITSLDGVVEFVQGKVKDIENVESVKRAQEEKKAAKDQKIEASFQADIAAAPKKDADISEKDKKISEVIGKSMEDISQKYTDFANKNAEKIKEHFMKSVLGKIISQQFDPECIKDTTESQIIEIYAKMKKDTVCKEMGIDSNSPEGIKIQEQIEADVEMASVKKELEDRIGQKLPDDPRPTKEEYETIKNIRKRLSQLKKNITEEQDPNRRVILTREFGDVMNKRMLWREDEMILLMQRRLEKGIVDQEAYDAVVELCNYRKKAINKRYDKNRKSISVEEVVDRQSQIVAEIQEGRNTRRYEESTCDEAEKIIKNCPPGFLEYADTFFERKVDIYRERIKLLENRLKSAKGLEKKEVEDDLMFANRYMKKYEAKDFILCATEMYDEYSKDKMGEILDKTIDSIQKIDKKIAENPDKDVYKRIKDEVIINFSQSCVESGASPRTMRDFILQKRELSREDRISMALQVQEFAVNKSNKGIERNDNDEYGGLPRALANKINGVRTIACAFVEEADKLLDEKSPEEAQALIEEFRKLEKNDKCDVRFYEDLTPENIDEKFNNIKGIAPEKTEFIKTIILRSIDSGIEPKKLKYYLKNDIIDHFAEEYSKLAKDAKSQENLEKFGESKKEETVLEEIPGAEEALDRLESDIDKERTRRKIVRSHEKAERKKVKQREKLAEAAKADAKENTNETAAEPIPSLPGKESTAQTKEESPVEVTAQEDTTREYTSGKDEALKKVVSKVRTQELTEEFSEIKNVLQVMEDKNKNGVTQNNDDPKGNSEQDIE